MRSPADSLLDAFEDMVRLADEFDRRHADQAANERHRVFAAVRHRLSVLGIPDAQRHPQSWPDQSREALMAVAAIRDRMAWLRENVDFAAIDPQFAEYIKCTRDLRRVEPQSRDS
jgi:hypothetical protein